MCAYKCALSVGYFFVIGGKSGRGGRGGSEGSEEEKYAFPGLNQN